MFYSRKELAERWRVHPNTIGNYQKQGLIPFVRLPGGKIAVYPRKEIERLERKGLTFERKVRL